MVGPIAVQHLEQFHVKTAFIGTDGFSLENGLTTHMMEATDVVRAMHNRSDRTVLLADSEKWGQAGFARIIPLNEIDTLVTDSGLPEDARTNILEMGIELLIVESKENGKG
jgi:DeoR family galactitol utilization operon repressor